LAHLELVRAGARAPAPPSADASSNVWLDSDGSPAAYGGCDDVSYWMELPGVGSFRFGDGASVTAFPLAGIGNGTVEDAFRRIVLPMALQARGQEVLHASAVAGPGGVVAVCAVSGTGKTTLAYALSRRGHRLWADDAVAFRFEGKAVVAEPLPFTLRLKGASADFFGPPPVGELHEPEADRLASVIVLSRDDYGHSVDRLDTGAAFPLILEHAYCFDLEDEKRKRQMITAYLELVERVPVYRVRMEAGLELLPRLLDRLEDHVLA
jgi:hypothetical protein